MLPAPQELVAVPHRALLPDAVRALLRGIADVLAGPAAVVDAGEEEGGVGGRGAGEAEALGEVREDEGEDFWSDFWSWGGTRAGIGNSGTVSTEEEVRPGHRFHLFEKLALAVGGAGEEGPRAEEAAGGGVVVGCFELVEADREREGGAEVPQKVEVAGESVEGGRRRWWWWWL